MPLYTYVLTFRGASHVAQGRHSNFRGFTTSWVDEVPANALPGFGQLRSELSRKAAIGGFDEVPNRLHVWRKTVDLDGDPFVVIAVQTES